MWHAGQRVNLEQSLKVGDELGGHIVSGHVDAVGRIADWRPEGDSTRLTVRAPAELAPFIAAKGSIAVDGVSLTVNEVTDRPDGSVDFGLNVIPHTAGGDHARRARARQRGQPRDRYRGAVSAGGWRACGGGKQPRRQRRFSRTIAGPLTRRGHHPVRRARFGRTGPAARTGTVQGRSATLARMWPVGDEDSAGAKSDDHWNERQRRPQRDRPRRHHQRSRRQRHARRQEWQRHAARRGRRRHDERPGLGDDYIYGYGDAGRDTTNGGDGNDTFAFKRAEPAPGPATMINRRGRLRHDPAAAGRYHGSDVYDFSPVAISGSDRSGHGAGVDHRCLDHGGRSSPRPEEADAAGHLRLVDGGTLSLAGLTLQRAQGIHRHRHDARPRARRPANADANPRRPDRVRRCERRHDNRGHRRRPPGRLRRQRRPPAARRPGATTR